MPLLRAVLPANVVVVEALADDPEVALPPEEAGAVFRAVESRRREYATTRRCAREVLAALGHPAAVLPRGERGEPLWPTGVVGSLTHCAGYRAAAASTRLTGLGIDAEPEGPLPPGTSSLVVCDDEIEVHTRRDIPRHWERILFSAKESAFKAWYPSARRWAEFTDARVTLAPEGSFRVEVLVPGTPVDVFDGRWALVAGLVLTAVTVP